ncbi:MAG: DUF1178 family protein [Rhodospirillales bacterium]|jgi:hypothetical protein|nr:DUF1178 family protein [Rhodospirillales bacterium]
MILYQLKCADEHQFEAWFKDAASFDEQSALGDILCPYCGSTHVRKAPMAPHLAKGEAKAEAVESRASEVATQIFQASEKLRKHVEENCDNVGDEFAEEARKIHYGESDERGIYGSATEEEAADLNEEGIEYYQIPRFPRRNH